MTDRSTDPGMAEAVRYLMEQQELVRAPKREPLPTPISSGGSMMTVGVAASDASELSKSKADFQCLGVDDQVTIRRAILAAGQWGTCWLSEGLFNCNIDSATGVLDTFGVLRGLGRQATWLQVNGTGAANEYFVHLSGAATLADLTIWVEGLAVTGAAVRLSGGFGDAVINCDVWAITGVGVKVQANNAAVEQSRLYGDRAALQLISGFDFTLSDSRLEGSTFGVEDVGFGGPMRVADSFIEGGTGILGGGDLTVVGCDVTGHSTWAVDIPAGAARGRIAANALIGGVRLTGADQYTVADNLIDATTHGILLDSTDDCDILGNQIDAPGSLAHNTYDGILLSGTSSRNNLQDNRIIGRVAASPKPRYAINISAAGCTSNVSNDNMAGPAGSFGTGVYNNAGTATQGVDFTI